MPKKTIIFSSISRKRRQRIRASIVFFCKNPRTLEEIKKEFNLNGISAAAIMSYLSSHGLVKCDYQKRTYKMTSKEEIFRYLEHCLNFKFIKMLCSYDY